uniref:Ovarian tumour, otubain, putative n=1 Tax=Medicago truncatula TaxID=3880 RepID=A2Q495_MEDTR|nr:Ovarian tumour, otubain, putative [Medicago truncatula]
MPKVIVTDRELSLMKAVANVFPESYAMNRYFHVQANVKQRCVLDCKHPLGKKDGKEVSNRDVVKKIMRAWKTMDHQQGRIGSCFIEEIFGAIPNHFVLIYLKNGCPLPPSSTEWHNHKKEDAVTWEDEYLDQHELFRKLMAIKSGNKPSKPQKESIKAAPILLDTPEKPKQQFKFIAEDEEDSMSLDFSNHLPFNE